MKSGSYHLRAGEDFGDTQVLAASECETNLAKTRNSKMNLRSRKSVERNGDPEKGFRVRSSVVKK
jgi:hypothetical protein